jgi:alkanesulfonate monooxygenase SsuD/methylene tetrahydromethanopterin reductase-like flavin-dependent oxidoreductase (luciferase family)
VARFADEYNVPFTTPETTAAMNANVDAVLDAADRDRATVVRSAAQVLCCGADDAELARRAAAIGRDVDEMRTDGMAGTPAELVAKLEAFAAVGVTRVYLQVLDLSDLEHLDLVADEVLPAAAALPGS